MNESVEEIFLRPLRVAVGVAIALDVIDDDPEPPFSDEPDIVLGTPSLSHTNFTFHFFATNYCFIDWPIPKSEDN